MGLTLVCVCVCVCVRSFCGYQWLILAKTKEVSLYKPVNTQSQGLIQGKLQDLPALTVTT